MNNWVEKWLKIYLKCFVNLVLYHRNVYPASTFDLTTFQGFNLPQFLPINRSKVLQDYIEELILDILDKLPYVYLISLCIIDCKDNLCIEKYCLDFGEFRHVSGGTDADNKKDSMPLKETDVFDEFRSSLNSLILQLERLPSIRDETVTFEVTLNTVDLGLGHGVIDMVARQDTDEVLQFERDTNWVRLKEDEVLASRPRSVVGHKGEVADEVSIDETIQPKIRMISLVSCDLDPLVIHGYVELLLTSDEIASNVYTPTTSPANESNI